MLLELCDGGLIVCGISITARPVGSSQKTYSNGGLVKHVELEQNEASRMFPLKPDQRLRFDNVSSSGVDGGIRVAEDL